MEKNNIKSSKIDVAVLLIFFCRDKKTEQVFNAIKEARPSKLYLYQDGAREGRQDDVDGIKKCREIVSDIDWDCEVHQFYQDKNFGCDPSEYIAQKWFFKNEEMGIILEDDDVPSQSFFPYCKELLERYKDDTRIHMICGMNNFDINKNVTTSYFFSRKGSIWGWASWRRVIDTWDPNYTFLDSENDKQLLRESFKYKKDYDAFIKKCILHRDSGREHYESINGASRRLNNRINIVPKYNMISNIGIDKETTHSVSNIKALPKSTQKLLYKKVYEIDFPLKHPSTFLVDEKYDKRYHVSRFKILFYKVERVIRKIFVR